VHRAGARVGETEKAKSLQFLPNQTEGQDYSGLDHPFFDSIGQGPTNRDPDCH
jgi:hypothetical protein